MTNARFTGAYAEYALASAAMIARRPVGLDPIDAASVPVVAVTAQQAIERAGGLEGDPHRWNHQSGESCSQAMSKSGSREPMRTNTALVGATVLIHGAAGSVGAYAVQLARRAGAHVIATAGVRDLGYVRGLGAEIVVDYRADRFEDVAHSVDAVLDFTGGEAQRRSFAVLRRGGTLISAVSDPDQALATQHGVTAAFFLVQVTSDRLTDLARLIEAGSLTTNVGAVLPLASARVAHEMLDGSRPRPRGKIVLRPE